jgi:hypothetical protein
MSGPEFTWHSEEHVAPVGSVQAEAMLEAAVTETKDKLMEGIEAFIEHVGKRS